MLCLRNVGNADGHDVFGADDIVAAGQLHPSSMPSGPEQIQPFWITGPTVLVSTWSLRVSSFWWVTFDAQQCSREGADARKASRSPIEETPCKGIIWSSTDSPAERGEGRERLNRRAGSTTVGKGPREIHRPAAPCLPSDLNQPLSRDPHLLDGR